MIWWKSNLVVIFTTAKKKKKNVRHRILKFLLHSTPTVGVFGIALCWRFANLLINNNTVNAIPIVFDIITCLTTFFFLPVPPDSLGGYVWRHIFFFFYKKLLQPSIVAVCHACAQEGATQLYTFAFTHLCQPTHTRNSRVPNGLLTRTRLQV